MTTNEKLPVLSCDQTVPVGWLRDDFHNWRDTGFAFASFSLAGYGDGLGETVRRISVLKKMIEIRSDDLVFAYRSADIREAARAGKLAIGINYQEGMPFEDRVELVQVHYDLGVTQSALAYNLPNALGDGCTSALNGGLTALGRNIVREMNRVGMLVDGSHVGRRTTLDAIEIAQAPFIFSHSNVDSIYPHPRNITDEQIRGCADTGGLVGINGIPSMLGGADTVEQIFKHIDYLCESVGSNHVGLGLDWMPPALTEGWPGLSSEDAVFELQWPPGTLSSYLNDPAAGPDVGSRLVTKMRSHGYTQSQIDGICGENYLRVMKLAEDSAA